MKDKVGGYTVVLCEKCFEYYMLDIGRCPRCIGKEKVKNSPWWEHE